MKQSASTRSDIAMAGLQITAGRGLRKTNWCWIAQRRSPMTQQHRKRRVQIAPDAQAAFAAVATSREAHRSPRSGPAGQHRRWGREYARA
jgi:hypothetical protein